MCATGLLACHDTGCFGAALMRTPEKVREIVYQMKRRVQIPVTVKCRLGVDNLDSPDFTRQFVEVIRVDPAALRILHDEGFLKSRGAVKPLEFVE